MEIQKIGYAFPGQRCACYSADLLLRQYKRIRSQVHKPQKFNYRDIKSVYTIILFETSSKAFHKYNENYIHNFEQKSDTGLKMELLQKYIFIPLDIFKENLHNNGIRSKLDAWLAFLCMDDPEWIIKIIQSYPEFKAMYEHAYDICLNIEKVMEMFSKELHELDRNTVLYMIDEMQEEINRQKAQLLSKDEQILQIQKEKDLQISQMQKDKDMQISQMRQRILELENMSKHK